MVNYLSGFNIIITKSDGESGGGLLVIRNLPATDFTLYRNNIILLFLLFFEKIMIYD